MNQEQFYLNPDLPFVEIRHTKNSGRHYKPHIHSTLSIGAIDNGQVLYNVEGKQALLSKGKLAIINPDTLHHCNPQEKAVRSYYMIYLDTQWCYQLQYALFGNQTFIPSNKILLDDECIYLQYINTVNIFLNDQFLIEKEQSLIQLLESIFLQLNACKEKSNSVTKSNNDCLAQIEQLKAYLKENLTADITVNNLALELNANPYTLLRQFKKKVGITPHAYRLNYKVEQAKHYLKKGLSISDVAFQCGFFDQSHLSRHFKTITTVTPKEYQVNFIQ